MNVTITRNLFNALLIAVLLVSSLVLADLPAYSGPHGVGIIQLENAVQDPQTITDTKFKNSGHPAFRLDTVLITLFYPTDPGAKSSKPPSAWYPEPRDLVAQGVSIGLGGSVTPSFVQAALNLVAGNLSIPAQVDVSLLSGGEILPVMIFSHGTFGMPEWYSQLCGEMASRGVMIASVTHRDGSTPATVVKFQNGTSYNLTAFTQDDVLPSMSETEFLQRQLEMRQAEFTEATRVLQSIANGSGQSIFTSSSRGEGQDIVNWKNRFDLSKLIVAGHSFGGSTVLRYLREPQPLVPAYVALPFDPAQGVDDLTNVTVKIPILIPNSEEYDAVPTDFYNGQYFDIVKSIAQGSLNTTGSAWFMTLLGTVHTSITDVGLVQAALASYFTNETQLITLDPLVAIEQYVNVTTDFLSFVGNKSIDGLLATGVTFPEFQLFPNASILSTPWEVHVAPNAINSSSPRSSNSSSNPKKALGSQAVKAPRIVELVGRIVLVAGISLMMSF